MTPVWSALPNQDGPIHPLTCLTSGYSYSSTGLSADDQLRYLLARRLARERRLKEAREFMPPDLLPLLDHNIALDRARRSGRYSGAASAAVVWRQALIHRHLGAELFSTDGAPDGGAREWMFSSIDFSSIRAFRSGWTHQGSSDPPFIASNAPADRANPAVTADEIRRTDRYAVKGGKRFHYRYAAADLAWEAAQMLPKNHPLLPRLYNTAGQWLSLQDPQVAAASIKLWSAAAPKPQKVKPPRPNAGSSRICQPKAICRNYPPISARPEDAMSSNHRSGIINLNYDV